MPFHQRALLPTLSVTAAVLYAVAVPAVEAVAEAGGGVPQTDGKQKSASARRALHPRAASGTRTVPTAATGFADSDDDWGWS